MTFNKGLLYSLSLGLMVVALTGCPPKKKMPIQDKPVAEEPVPSPTDELTSALPEEVQISQDWSEIPALSVVLFDYDSASLTDGQRATLKTNVAVLKKLPQTVTIRVEGHCDDRGTVEYNVALGQKRANAVSSFYSTAGLAKSRIKTISFGEERLICSDQSESCWSQNRRGVTTVRNDQPLTISPDTLK